jgi:alcohol dehydrogenase class IV
VKPFRYFVPTEIVLGPGCLNTLGDHARSLGKKALVVTGKNSARANGALDRVLAQVPDATLFDGVEENPISETCMRGAAVCREKGCDFVVAIGGGSAMDTAKAIAVLAHNPGTCADYFGVDKYSGGNLPIIAVPTTAGTGSEVTPYSVIVDSATRVKRTIVAQGLFPKVALLDPELSRTMPRPVTVHTGLDALSQAMEGMVSLRSTPFGDALALEACRIVKTWLPRAAAHPNDIEARSQMLFAAMLSGCVIAQSGTTLIHSMGYYFTLEYGLAHGLANALLLTPVFQFDAKHLPEKVAAIASALGRPTAPNSDDAQKNIALAIHALLDELDVSPAAKDTEVDLHRLQAFAEDIFADRSRFKNQPGDPSLDDVFQFFQRAYYEHDHDHEVKGANP